MVIMKSSFLIMCLLHTLSSFFSKSMQLLWLYGLTSNLSSTFTFISIPLGSTHCSIVSLPSGSKNLSSTFTFTFTFTFISTALDSPKLFHSEPSTGLLPLRLHLEPLLQPRLQGIKPKSCLSSRYHQSRFLPGHSFFFQNICLRHTDT